MTAVALHTRLCASPPPMAPVATGETRLAKPCKGQRIRLNAAGRPTTPVAFMPKYADAFDGTDGHFVTMDRGGRFGASTDMSGRIDSVDLPTGRCVVIA